MIAPLYQPRRTDGGSRPRRAGRRGNSLLEVQVAFALLGIGLAGLCPLVVMQLRQVAVLESRIQGQVSRYDTTGGSPKPMMQQFQYDPTSGTYKMQSQPQTYSYYLVPWRKPWAQRLSGAAQVVVGASTSPCEPPTIQGQPSYQVNIISATASGQVLTATVEIDPMP
jgi:Tfp pilus assembly protein PilV